MIKKYNAIGLMSGTSLDGLDIAACEFILENSHWSYTIIHSHTFAYSENWKKRLESLPQADALSFSFTNSEYGHLLGRLTRSFIETTGFKPDLIASHGHTIFHQPAKSLTVQIGSGSGIAAETGIPVICDFRSTDVALGGQGAPLVPIGDRLLFSSYDACLNLGGFANISMEKNGNRIAFDICPANIILNYLATKIGVDYDKDGEIARQGKIKHAVLEKLNLLPYYIQPHPKSLGREWVELEILPLLDIKNNNINDLMRTMVDHIALQVNNSAGAIPQDIMVTGGGALNKFLMEQIRLKGNHHWTIPADDLIQYKEALIFAFLGLLRWRNEVNILCSVTGSKYDHSGGALYLPH